MRFGSHWSLPRTRPAGEHVPQAAGLRLWRRPRQSGGLRYRAIFKTAAWALLVLAPLLLFALAGRADSLRTRQLGPVSAAALTAPRAVTWSAFAPAAWVTTTPVTASVVADAPNGFVSATAAYAVSTDGGGAWSAWTTAGLTVGGAISATQTLTVTGLALADSATANQVRFQIEEISGTLETSAGFPVQVDTAAPTSIVTSPAPDAILRVAPVIAGTANDATSGVAQVVVSLRAVASGLYWNGTAWDAAEQWLPAAGIAYPVVPGTIAWTYTGAAPAWASGESYAIRSRATDAAGNVETPGAGIVFTFDTTPPAVALIAPHGGELWAGGRVYTITWSASDAVGLAATPITLSVSSNGGAAWTLIAVAISNTGSFSWTTPLVDSNQMLIEVEAVDRAGNRATARSNAAFTVSSSPPAAPLNLQATPANWTSSTNFSASWTNPPGLVAVIGAWYKLDAAPVAAGDGTFITTTTWLWNIKPATDGAHPLYVWLGDQFGRADHTRTATTTLRLDRTPPAPPFALLGDPARTWTNVNSFTERWTNPPDLAGVVGAYYQVDRPGYYPTDGIFISTTTVITGIVVPADGKHDLYLWLVDAAGNVDQNNRNVDPQVFWFDSTPPVSAITVQPAVSANGWYSLPVTFQFSAQDGSGGSGVDAVLHQVDQTGWSSLASELISVEGQHTIGYTARDVAGNLEPTHTLTITLDFTPPVATLTPQRPPLASGWYTASIGFTLAVTDALSQGNTAYYRLDGGSWQAGASFQVTTNGIHQVDYFGQDAAGNRSPTGSLQVKVDTLAPATAYLIEGTQSQSGWYTSPLTIRLIPTDGGSGVAGTFYRLDEGAWQLGSQFSLAVDGVYSLFFYSIDIAGNTENSFPVQIKLDTAAPIAPTVVQTTPADWSRTNRFTVQWANPTDLSGIAGVYYRLDTEPTAADDGIFSPLTNRLDNLTVPAEGQHRLYLWLADNAGNADHRNRIMAPLLRYDATPPTTTLQVQGVAGAEGWYTSGLIVTLNSTDAQSGVANTRYRLDSGDWISGTALTITTPDKHLLEYDSQDVAGNAEATRQITLRMDPNPPDAPIGLAAEPAGWQHFNSFRLLWQNPLDQSGIAGAYVRFDRPPAGPADGVFYPASQVIEGLPAPGEGQHDLYVWLRDHAGNSNYHTAVALPSALWYDGLPPTTVVTLTGNQGQNGWYLGPVAFVASATDTGSGVAETRWQLDEGLWTAGVAATVSTDGQHVVRFASSDVAGNAETPLTYAVALDQQPPFVAMARLSHYQPSPHFEVAWAGNDATSGLAGFDVQVRDGLTGSWQNWLTGTALTGASFDGQRGHNYAFRVRARDRAGNVQQFTDGSAYTVVDSVRNGSFDSGNFSEWTTSGLLRKAVLPTGGPGGVTSLAARLGSPEYGPSIEEPGQVPVGSATITQTVVAPPSDQVARPTLAFWYRIFSYDVLYSERLQRFVDTFEVSVYDPTAGTEADLLLRTGNVTNRYGSLYDSGWRLATLDLRRYAGKTVQLIFANYNREDNLFNTWSYVDSIQVQDWPYSERRYLPLVVGGPAGNAVPQSAGLPAVIPPEAPRGKR